MFGELKNSFGLKLSDNHQFIILYCIALLFVIIFTLSKSFYFYKWCITVSSTLHANMFTSILYSPMKFFNQNPSGRILNRFSKDLGILDELIPVTLMDTLNVMNYVGSSTAIFSIFLVSDRITHSIGLSDYWSSQSLDSSAVSWNVPCVVLRAESIFGDEQRY